MTPLELAERCEQATGPETDALLQEAWTALFPKPSPEDEPRWEGTPGTLREPLFHNWKVRQLTFQALLSVKASLDAAMTLVPEGWVGLLGIPANGGCKLQPEDEPQNAIETRAATPALALCAAALKARAHA